jgi:hypothetical protein
VSQNSPNPANNTTLIHYSIPFAGEITFTVCTVNGISLYKRTFQAESGGNNIEINTSDFAAGIYFYMIEFNNQRIVKKMSVIQ